jgi:poly-beta-1,6-N-acetyl-D-glucosamine biosynthesis protein PgaD
MGSNARVRVDMKTGEGLIIDRPGLVSKLKRYSEWTYNLLAWAFWLFLLRPLLILLLWYLGVRIAYHQMVFLEGFDNPAFFGFVAASIAVILAVAFAWNRYNYFRFRGVDRRKPSGPCGPEELAKYYKMSVQAVESLQMAPYVEVSFGGDETISLSAEGGRSVNALYAPQSLAKHRS